MGSIYGFKVFYEEEEKKQRKAYLETIDFLHLTRLFCR